MKNMENLKNIIKNSISQRFLLLIVVFLLPDLSYSQKRITIEQEHKSKLAYCFYINDIIEGPKLAITNDYRGTKINNPTGGGSPRGYIGVSRIYGKHSSLSSMRGIDFGLTPLNFALAPWRHDRHLITSLGISWTRYNYYDNSIGNRLYEFKANDILSDYIQNSLVYKKSSISYFSVRMPVEIRLSNLMFGLEGEYRFGIHADSRFSGETRMRLCPSDTEVNRWGLNAIARYGFLGYSLFCRVSLTSLFKDTYPLSSTQLTIGICLFEE